VFQRPHILVWSILLSEFLAAFSPRLLSSQAVAPDANARPVFKASAKTVILNVVVTGKNGQPVRGLHKEDFLAAEDGHPQTITAFEEHGNVKPAQAAILPNLPPNVFTNVPLVMADGAATVLLLDNLNTQLQDQSGVRAKMLNYLKGVHSSGQFAIFALGTQLHYVQGFTDDPALLMASLKDPRRGAGADPPPFPLRNYQTEQELSQLDLRVRLTLQAFEELAHYLAGIPGRKTVVWFSSSFPMVVMNPLLVRDYQEQVKSADAVMASAGVALYPIASEALATDALYDVNDQPIGATNAQQAQQQAIGSLQNDAKQRNANHTTMDEIARDTGGVAAYNTNGFNDALARIVAQNSCYYTLAYTPTNPASDGKFRNIQIKLNSGNDRLVYRRGYYAANDNAVRAAEDKLDADPLRSYMVPGAPDSTQIPLVVRVRAAQQAGPKTAPRAGDNANVQGPLTRYAVDFVIAARGLQLDSAPDGGRNGKIEAALVVYGPNGMALNWTVRQLDLTMDAERYKEVQANGVNFLLEIDVPKGGLSLRSGVYDRESNLAGALEIPLSAVANSSPTTALQ
jgi:VWFA-related protein